MVALLKSGRLEVAMKLIGLVVLVKEEEVEEERT